MQPSDTAIILDIHFNTLSLSVFYGRMCVWESIAMKRVLQKNWGDPSAKPKKPQNATAIPGTIDFNIEELGSDDKDANAPTPAADPYNPVTINTKYFNFVLTQTPHCITPLYQGTDVLGRQAMFPLCYLSSQIKPLITKFSRL